MDVSNDSVFFDINSDVSSSVQSLQKLSETLNSLNNILTIGTKRINSFTKAIQSLSSINTAQIQTIINNLNQINNFKASTELNKLANSLESVGNLAPKINAKVVNQLGESTKNLKNNMSGLPSTVSATTNALNGLPTNLKRAANEVDNLSNKNSKIKDTNSLLSKLSSTLKLGTLVAGIKGVSSTIGKFVNLSNDYIENVNLFNVSMGSMAGPAKEFVDNFSDVLGVDPSNVMRYTGIFNTLAEGFGIADEEAYTMSKNLTQLSYDMSSFLNIPIEEAMQKLRSGFVGEIEPMRAIGIALDEATLQETAYALGIDRKVSAMTRAQKTELLYYQIMTRTTQMQGDMARTLIQPANALRVLKQEFTQLGRAIGNIFIPMLMAIIPYVKVVVQWLTAAAQAIANFFGFQIDTSSWSNLADTTVDVASGIDDIGNSASGATKELKKMLAPFDELNVIEFGNDKNSGSGSGSDTGIGGSLGIPIPEYDATTGALTQNLEEVEKKLKSILPYATLLGAIFLSWKVGSGIINFLGSIGILSKFQVSASLSTFFKTLSGIGLIIGGAIAYIQGFSEILKENGNVWEGLGKVLIGVGVIMAGVALIFGGVPALITGAILLIAALATAIATHWEEIKAGLSTVADWINENVIQPIKDFFSPVVDWINENIIQPIANFFSWLWGEIGAPLENLWTQITGAFSSGWEAIQLVWEKAQPFFEAIWEGITATFKAAWEIIKSVWDVVKPYFESIWNSIKSIFSVVSSVLGGFFKTAWEAIKAVWNTAVNFFSIVWAGIKAIFEVVKGVLSGDFSGAWEAIKNVWSQVVNFFSGIWEGIKNVFGSVADWFRDVFSKAWQAVKDVFSTGGQIFSGIVEGIANVLKTVVNAIIKGINKVIAVPFNALNSMLRKIRDIDILGLKPFSWIGTFSVPQIPLLAEGGFPNQGQMFIAREAGPELVGNIGNKSAVANNDQIIEGIRQGVYSAVVEANTTNNIKQPVNVYIGNKKVYSGYGSYANAENNMYGANVIR